MLKTIYYPFLEEAMERFAAAGADEVFIQCRTKQERADVLLAMRDHGCNIHESVDRSYHIQPDSPLCNFDYPHVSFSRRFITCSCGTPAPGWLSYETFMEYVRSYDQEESDEAPEPVWLN